MKGATFFAVKDYQLWRQRKVKAVIRARVKKILKKTFRFQLQRTQHINAYLNNNGGGGYIF